MNKIHLAHRRCLVSFGLLMGFVENAKKKIEYHQPHHGVFKQTPL